MIVNGYSYGKIEILGTSDIPVNITIDLPKTNSGSGLEETMQLAGVSAELIDIDTLATSYAQEPDGFKLMWNYHYEDWMKGEDLFLYYPILKAWKQKQIMRLTPRVDVPERTFFVKLVSETLSLRITPHTRVSGGFIGGLHKGALFTFRCIQTLDDPNWILVAEPGTNIGVINNFLQTWVASNS